jgi:T-complex protein 1 subunit beta
VSLSTDLLSPFAVFHKFRADPVKFRQDLVNIARTTLSSKVLSQDKAYFSNLAVDAVLRLKVRLPSFIVAEIFTSFSLQGSTDLDHIQIIKKVGGKLTDSYLDEGEARAFWRGLVFSYVAACVLGFILDKSIGVNSPKRLENANILIANTCASFLSHAFFRDANWLS